MIWQYLKFSHNLPSFDESSGFIEKSSGLIDPYPTWIWITWSILAPGSSQNEDENWKTERIVQRLGIFFSPKHTTDFGFQSCPYLKVTMPRMCDVDAAVVVTDAVRIVVTSEPTDPSNPSAHSDLLELGVPAQELRFDLSWKVRSARDRTIRTFQIGVRLEFLESKENHEKQLHRSSVGILSKFRNFR